ncbi:MAG TPA: maleylpyruvate isomerase N-terminal domain-containing protein [Pseudonocardia sp.]|nr:maleylpyruvate isomerase N-terminal domain-containing protein [Pseudonocardia sp.]
MSTPRTTFLAAAGTVADLVDAIPDTAWDGPGLGEWDLRALVGHTSRSLITVVTYLGQPAATEEVGTPEAYYAMIARAGGASSPGVAERGRAAGAALGDEPAVAFRALQADATAALDRATDDDLLTTIVGGMRLAAYLPTRTFELTVHGADIAAATGLPVTFPPAVLAEAAALAARTAVELGRGPAVLAALTGRVALPPGFSVV